MDLFTFPGPEPNQVTSSDNPGLDLDSEHSYDEWVLSDEMELVLPVGTDSTATLPIGEYSPVESPIEYSYDLGGSYSAFDFPQSSLTIPLSDFDFGNLDSWPTELNDMSPFTSTPISQPGMAITEGSVWSTPQESVYENQDLDLKSPTNNSIEEVPPSPENSKQSRTKPKLSSSRRKSSTKSSPRSTPHSPDHRSAQHHNQIEKKYRASINDRFAVLRAALPETILSSEEVEPGTKKLGKADVLVGALRYVKELEEEGRRLLVVRGDLIGSIDVWEKRWGDSRGGGWLLE